MIGAFSSAWTLLRHPSIAGPAVAAIAALSAMSAALMVSASTSNAGSWFGSQLPPLTDVGHARTLPLLVGSQGVPVGIVMGALAALHVGRQLSVGLIRVQLAAQPRRHRWFTGTWLALASAAVVASALAALAAVGAGYAYASAHGIDTGAWSHGISSALGVFGSLSLATIAFTFVGAALGLALGSPIPAVVVGFLYAMFETTITAVSPVGRGLLPVSAFTATATAGFSDPSSMPSVIAALVFTVAVATGAFGLITSRNVTD